MEKEDKKIKCCKCGVSDAVWLYMPGHSDGKDFFCDNCVPRGCGCNIYSLKEFPLEKKKEKNYIFWDEKIENYTTELSDKSHYYEVVDKNTRRYPCCEYEYNENGFYPHDFITDYDED